VKRREGKNTYHPHEVLLTVFLFADVAAVIVTISGASPTPETATFLLFLADGTFTRCIYDGVVIANSACDVEVGWGRGGELGVEGVEDAHGRITAASILVALPGVLVVRWAERGRPRERRCGSR
jgi:hypothetical protein